MSVLAVEKSTKVYVAAPANLATGGPELLHQLVYELRKLNIDAFMYYYDVRLFRQPVHESYITYENPYVSRVDDKAGNIFLVPEVRTDLLFKYKRMQKVIWWLSVDNYVSRHAPISRFSRLLAFISRKIFRNRIFDINHAQEIKITHFVQSEYARNYLESKKIDVSNISYLSDYLNPFFVKQQLEKKNADRKNIVVYNPSKGIEFTKKIINKATEIKFIPIQGMNKEAVSDLLCQAKVYIDFGGHPGKDRIPREACISGVCVITNLSGSARFYNDVPIPDKYKFEDSDDNLDRIIKQIKGCLLEYETCTRDFEEYRTMIRGEQDRFVLDIKKIFLPADGF